MLCNSCGYFCLVMHFVFARLHLIYAGRSPLHAALSSQQRCHVPHLTCAHGFMQPPPLTVAPAATAEGSAAPPPVPPAAKQQWRRCPLLRSRKPARGQAEAAQGWSTSFCLFVSNWRQYCTWSSTTHNCKTAHTNEGQPYINIAVCLLQTELIQTSAMSVSLKS